MKKTNKNKEITDMKGLTRVTGRPMEIAAGRRKFKDALNPQQEEIIDSVAKELGFEDRHAMREAMENGSLDKKEVRQKIKAAFQEAGVEAPKRGKGPKGPRGPKDMHPDQAKDILEALAKALGYDSFEDMQAALNINSDQVPMNKIIEAVINAGQNSSDQSSSAFTKALDNLDKRTDDVGSGFRTAA